MSGAQREMRSDELVEAMENLHQYPRLIAERAYAEGLAAGTLAPTPPDAPCGLCGTSRDDPDHGTGGSHAPTPPDAPTDLAALIAIHRGWHENPRYDAALDTPCPLAPTPPDALLHQITVCSGVVHIKCKHAIKCSRCGGDGEVAGNAARTVPPVGCPSCGGTGFKRHTPKEDSDGSA